MKTALFAFFVLIFAFTNTKAQTPKSFNYQAVVRNNNGSIIANQNVSFKISILQGNANAAPVYIETHLTTTDAIGLASLQIGQGSSLLSQFSLINWALGDFFIKIEVDPTGQNNYVLSNITKLLSVPYALYAENSNNTGWNKNANNIFNSNSGNVGIGTNSPNSKLEVKGSGDTLFQVKDNAGNPVFVVFPEGVRVFVKENAAGNLGGFAVSGRSASKATTYNDVFLVTPDSTRVYVNNNAKGNLGGFAVSGRSASKGNTQKYMFMEPENYFIGHEAGFSNAGGLYNSFIGFQSGYKNANGSNNYFIGYRAGYNNQASDNIFIGDSTGFTNTTGYNNIFIGGKAGFYNTSGFYNVATGYQSMYSNTTGHYNVATGYQSMNSNTTGIYNVATGFQSLYSNTIGPYNVANGYMALFSNTEGSQNVAIGSNSLYYNTTGFQNISIGMNSLYLNTIGYGNVACGTHALSNNTEGIHNIASGNSALNNNKNGSFNIAYGYCTLYNNTYGNYNVATGISALTFNTLGDGNVAIGYESLNKNTIGKNNTAIGFKAFHYGTEYENSTAIGANTYIYKSNMVRIGDANVTVIEGQVAYTFPSDGRFKNNVKEEVKGLDFINKLRPVTYNFDTKKYDAFLMKNVPDSLKNKRLNETDYNESTSIIQSGFIAQEVEKAALETGYIFNGVHKPANDNENYSIAYSLLTVPLVKAVQELDKKHQIQNIKNQELDKKNIELNKINDKQNQQIIEMQNQIQLLIKEIEKLKNNK